MQTVITKYHGPTNTRSARMSASCNAGKISVPFDHGESLDANHRAVAEALRAKIGWTHAKGYSSLIGGTMSNGDYAWNFEHTPKFNEDLVTRNPRKRNPSTLDKGSPELTVASLKIAKNIGKQHGFDIRYNGEYNEYQVKPSGVHSWNDASVYYTDDITDAVGTGKAMAAHVAKKNPAPRMLNSLEVYEDAGFKSGKARKQGDESTAKFHADWAAKAMRMEVAENKAYAKAAYNNGYKRGRGEISVRTFNPAPRVPSLGFAIVAQHNGPRLHYNGKDFTDNGTPKRYTTKDDAYKVAVGLLDKFPLLKKYRIWVQPTRITPRGKA